MRATKYRIYTRHSSERAGAYHCVEIRASTSMLSASFTDIPQRVNHDLIHGLLELKCWDVDDSFCMFNRFKEGSNADSSNTF
ncbi:hypothetical protein MPTK2_8g16160 [Marchantia polymorpha subsp. ruderalis]